MAPASTSRARLRRDPRLLIGLLLVAGSVAAVVGIVAAADEGDEVLVAPRLLTAGELITADDLEPRRVTLGLEASAYLHPNDVPAEGLIVTRTIGQGELVPIAALGDERSPRATTLVVALSTPIGATVREGDVLDLWSAPALEAGRFGAPAVIASGAQLVREVQPDGIVAGAEAARVELLVPRHEVARILHALANGDALSAVPVSLAVGG